MSAYANSIAYFFRHFWEEVDKIPDPRVRGRCIYGQRTLLATEQIGRASCRERV